MGFHCLTGRRETEEPESGSIQEETWKSDGKKNASKEEDAGHTCKWKTKKRTFNI